MSERPARSHRVALAEAVQDGPVEVWNRKRTTDIEGRVTEEVTITQDERLVDRVDELGGPEFHDPDVIVNLEDYADSHEDGSSVTGSRLVLQPRRFETEGEVRAEIEAVTKLSYEDYQARVAARERADHPTREESLEQDLADAEAAGEEETKMLVRFAEEPPTELPHRLARPTPPGDLERLDRDIERLAAIAVRGEEILELQRGFVEWAESEGARVSIRYWLHNQIAIVGPPELMRQIAAREDVAWVSRANEAIPQAIYDRQVIRDAIQAQPYLDQGFDGNRTSSRNGNGIWVGLIESGDTLSLNHEGLDSIAAPSLRVLETWDTDAPNDHSLDACTGTHGMAMANLIAGDFTEDQHSAVIGAEQAKRSGTAQEAWLWFATLGDFPLAVEMAVQDNIDILNFSTSVGFPGCDPVGDDTEPVMDAYFDGILFIAAQGNTQFDCDFTRCDATNQAASAGSVSVTAHHSDDGNGPPEEAQFCTQTQAADGRASWGPVPDIMAPGGSYTTMNCSNSFDPSTGSCAGTSDATANVSGAATVLMDHWIYGFSDATAHSPGRMHQVLFLLGDGCQQEFGTSGVWGNGRFRMRKFDTTGLDAPYKARFSSVVLTPQDHLESWYTNENAQGALIAVPADANTFAATAFCRHTDPSDFTGDILLYLWDVDDDVVFPEGVEQRGEKNKVTWALEGHRYVLTINVTELQSSVACWVGWFWEDDDRDDANGPPAEIEPYHVYGGPTEAHNCMVQCIE